MKCEHCGFTSENKDILKLHAVSHQISLMDIMTNLPASIKEASFKTEDEFFTDLKGFLENSSVAKSEDKELTLTVECGECDKKLQLRKIRKEDEPSPGLPESKTTEEIVSLEDNSER